MAIDHKFSNTGACQLGELLKSNGELIVPKFQRNFSWSNEKVSELWSDLMNGFQRVKDESELSDDVGYLLGSIVLVRHKNNKYWVIDGQQRLSVITMLFCVARDIIRENIASRDSNSSPDGYDKIMEVLENTRMGKHTSWKLVLNDTDKKLFRQIQEYEMDPEPQIKRITNLKPKTKSEWLLRDSYMFLHEKLLDSLYTNFSDEPVTRQPRKPLSSDEKKKLIKDNLGMLNYFLAHVQENNFVIKIVVADNSTAYQIFETLNNRGQTLSKSNLIKNYLMGLVKDNDDNQRELSDRWNTIFDGIIGQGQPDDEFILESLRSRYSDRSAKISLKRLYKNIREIIKNEDECRKFIDYLEDDAHILKTFNDPNKYEDKETLDDIYSMKSLKGKIIRVLVLTAYRKWGVTKDYRELVRFLVKFFFKIKIVQKTHAGTVEKIILKASKMTEKGCSLQEILDELRKHDNHKNFIYDFREKFMLKPDTNAAKYALQQINILGARYDDVRPIDSLTLEHVLPLRFDKWSAKDFFVGYSKELKMEEFVCHLGNLTLLKDEVNSKIQNEPFSYKKKNAYEKSQLKINTDTVCDKDEWTANIIEERGRRFAELADGIWDLDPK